MNDWMTLRRDRCPAFDLLTGFGITGPPVPIFELASRMGVPVLRVSEPGWSAALHVEETPPRVQVWLRDEDDQARQRFALAHELGHLLLGHAGPVFRDATFWGGREELDASEYGARLLIPEPWAQHYMDACGWDIDRVSALFQVPVEVTRTRADHLLGMAGTPFYLRTA